MGYIIINYYNDNFVVCFSYSSFGISFLFFLTKISIQYTKGGKAKAKAKAKTKNTKGTLQTLALSRNAAHHGQQGSVYSTLCKSE